MHVFVRPAGGAAVDAVDPAAAPSPLPASPPPSPAPLAKGNAGVSPSKHTSSAGPVGSPPGAADSPDAVTSFLTEDALMDQILEATR